MNYRKLYEKFGEDKYLLKVCEELSELQVAILHWSEGKATRENVLEEIADVELQLEKIKQLLAGFDDDQWDADDTFTLDIRIEKERKLEKITEGG